jgi:hypothetical protein
MYAKQIACLLGVVLCAASAACAQVGDGDTAEMVRDAVSLEANPVALKSFALSEKTDVDRLRALGQSSFRALVRVMKLRVENGTADIHGEMKMVVELLIDTPSAGMDLLETAKLLEKWRPGSNKTARFLRLRGVLNLMTRTDEPATLKTIYLVFNNGNHPANPLGPTKADLSDMTAHGLRVALCQSIGWTGVEGPIAGKVDLDPGNAHVKVAQAPVFSSPDEKGYRCGYARKDESLWVYREKNGWCEIEGSGEFYGIIPADDVVCHYKVGGSTWKVSADTKIYAWGDSAENVPESDLKVLGTAEKGSEIFVAKSVRDGKYYQTVLFTSVRFWIQSSHIEWTPVSPLGVPDE